MINRRLVFLFPGFEPMRAGQHCDRFVRAANRSAPFWESQVSFNEPHGAARSAEAVGGNVEPAARGGTKTPAADTAFATLEATLSGAQFETHTKIVVCDWGDLILAYGEKPSVLRFLRGYGALADFLVTGTFFRYCATSWRYALFFVFPIAVVVGAFLSALLVAKLVAPLLPNFIGAVAGAAAAAALIVAACRRMHLLTALDDWTLARDLCRGRNPDLSARIELQARRIGEQVGGSCADEIVVAAHSLGACLAVLALSKAMSHGFVPDERLSILTVGSSLLKTALHPAAGDHRAAVDAIVRGRGLPWIECQALSDVINFYKSNPAGSLGIRTGRMPTVVRLHIRRLLTEATYLRIRRDFFRVHRQFVLAVERRAPYSFHMLLLGPLPLSRYAETKTVNHPPLVANPSDAPAAAA